MTRRTSISKLALLPLPLLMALVGCGEDSTFATDPGESVLVPALTGFNVYSQGGGLYIPGPPTGAACHRDVWSYSVDLNSSALTWDRCAISGAGTEPADYVRDIGTRTLSASELEGVKTAARAVRVSAGTSCGADKSSYMLRVSSGAESLLYGDEFYACEKLARHYVQGIDGLSVVVAELPE